MKPSFFKNENLATLSPLNRLLLPALWCMADREGRLEDRPLRIKAEAFPYDACDIDKMLNKLADFQDPFIIRYQVDSKRYIQVVKASAHFHPHPNEVASIIPPPPPSTLPPMVKGLHPKVKVLLPIPEPLGLNPLSPILKSESPLTESMPPRGGFEIVWKDYPRREGKKTAERHYNASVKTMQDFLDLKNALSNYLSQLQANRTEMQFTKMGATWFNNWRDYVGYKVNHSQILKAPTLPVKPKAIEAYTEPSYADLKAMHEDRIKAMGPCALDGCQVCMTESPKTIEEISK